MMLNKGMIAGLCFTISVKLTSRVEKYSFLFIQRFSVLPSRLDVKILLDAFLNQWWSFDFLLRLITMVNHLNRFSNIDTALHLG